MTPGLLDYHTHLERGPLTAERLESFLDVARDRGIAELGVSEHAHRFCDFAPVMVDLGSGTGSHEYIQSWLEERFRVDLNEYVTLVEAAKKGGLPIKLGTEVDYLPRREEAITAWLDSAPWDYVIGSVHFIGKWGFDFSPELGWQGRDVDRTYRRYFSLVERAARSGLFDIIAHFDLVKLFGHRPVLCGPEKPPRYINNALEAVREAGCCIELNTAGWRRPVGELYPAVGIMKVARHMGIPITLGSDAHEPEHVGYRLAEAACIAREAGYRTMTRVARRSPEQTQLPGVGCS